MNCTSLPNTGLTANLGLYLTVAAGCLVVGTVLVLARRRRRTAAAAFLMALSIAGGTFVIPPATPAHVSASSCGTGEHFLTVTQTSTMDGLAPGLAPVLITGLVQNNSSDSTYITAVDVEITAVTTLPGTRTGTCDADDYLLRDPRMPVELPVGPGETTSFTGAAIGLRNKATNQNACQHATVHLLYTANPGP